MPEIKVTSHDIPLACPRPGKSVGFFHPIVYLPIEKTRSVMCPYCSTRYRWVDE